MGLRRNEERKGRSLKDVMTREVLTCSPEDRLSRAAQLMWDGDVGTIAVVEASRPIAMLTDRDLCMAAFHRDARPSELRVRDAMSRELYCVRVDEPLEQVERTMRERQVRRVPIVDAENRLIGIVSLNDIALDQGAISDAAVSETLRAVCEPHRNRAHQASGA